MMIPRYRMYWRASGLWAIPRKWRMVAGAATLLVVLPGAHALLDGPWLVAAHIAVVIAGIGLICGD